MKTTAQRKAERKRERKERLYGPVGFVEWLKAQPCARCGRGPSEVHHDPTAANGGTWRTTAPLCNGCHTGEGDSRHRHPGGHKGFWGEIGRTREEVTAAVQERWERFSYDLWLDERDMAIDRSGIREDYDGLED